MHRGWMGVCCAAAGLVMLCGPRATEDRPAAAAPDPGLRIATWNIQCLNRHDNEGCAPRVAGDYLRLRQYARRLDADVVALQEVDGEEAARRVFDPQMYRFHFTADAGNPQRTGFAFREDLDVTLHHDLNGLALGATRRGADITVRRGGAAIRILSIHLKSGCWGDPLRTDTPACRILKDQLPVLERWIDARARAGIPFAVLGDFNRRFEPPDRFWPEIDDADPPEADLTDVVSGRRSGCWGGEFLRFIDHIVLSRGAAAWVAPGSFEQLLFDPEDTPYRSTLSDHCPIAVTLGGGTHRAPAAPAAGGAASPATIPAGEAVRHVGETATVCGVVASARYARSTRGRPTFLNLDRAYPDQIFTVVIWGGERAAFEAPERKYAGTRICVTGRITSYHGRAEIVATRPEQIVEAGAGPP
jgi:endonuclease/exonuclease/phosphatase family metal-dependent hydrolase